ncbi:MAG: ThuA domain-containing protein [Sedimentisphaerales bacterium]|nr:ThuA domain-containing protein [Sedimentisphaerales bacterium]
MKNKPVVCLLVVATINTFLWAVEAPKPRSRSEVEAVLAKAPKALPKNQLRQLNVVLIAFQKDHKENEHDYPLWQKRWAVLLGGQKTGQAKQVNLYGPPPEGKRKGLAGVPKVNVSTANGWPSEEQLERADLIVAFCYVQYDEKKLKQLEKFLARGGGYVILHPAVIIPRDKKDIVEPAAKLLGLAWEYDYTRYRHGEIDLKIAAPEHPICLGLPETIHVLDESYWPLKGDHSKITILATSEEMISKDSEQTKPEPMFYTYEYGKGRVFSCILGHYTWTFDDPYVRTLLLRGMAWAAGESPYRFDRLVLRGIALSDE